MALLFYISTEPYEAPLGNLVNFLFTGGYTAPAGESVNLDFDA